jgi:hypothetical protein
VSAITIPLKGTTDERGPGGLTRPGAGIGRRWYGRVGEVSSPRVTEHWVSAPCRAGLKPADGGSRCTDIERPAKLGVIAPARLDVREGPPGDEAGQESSSVVPAGPRSLDRQCVEAGVMAGGLDGGGGRR